MRQFVKFGIWCISLMVILFSNSLYAQSNSESINQDNLFEISKNLDIMANVFKQLNMTYLYDIDPNELTDIGLTAMLKSLDPYTVFYNESDLEDFLYQKTGVYKGIGIRYIKNKDSAVIVTEVISDGPAAEVGIGIGDELISVNDKQLKELALSDIENFLKRTSTEVLNVKIKKAFTGEVKIYNITKSEVENNKLGFAGWTDDNKDIAVVKVNRFVSQCSDKLEHAIDSLYKENRNMKGIILDLRSNPGGLLMEAISMVNIFIPKNNLVVYTKGKFADDQHQYFTEKVAKYDNIPLTVLVDSFSASASEIVSGCLQDYDRAVIIGKNTYGKGLVQTTAKLSFQTQMKLTSSKYFIPSERCIQALDYSKEDGEGHAYLVKESERQSFKTKNGRVVKDGRGVTPDILITLNESSQIKELQRKNLIFDFVTEKINISQLRSQNVKNYKIDDAILSTFYDWLRTTEHINNLEMFNEWDKFEKKAHEGQFVSQSDLDKMQTEIINNLIISLKNNSGEIKKVINDEVERRLYDTEYSYNLHKSEDPYIGKAVEILRNSNSYNKILNK